MLVIWSTNLDVVSPLALTISQMLHCHHQSASSRAVVVYAHGMFKRSHLLVLLVCCWIFSMWVCPTRLIYYALIHLRWTVWSTAMPHTYHSHPNCHRRAFDDGISDDAAELRNFQTMPLCWCFCVCAFYGLERWEEVNLFGDASVNVCLPFQWHNYVCNEMNCGMSHEFHVR